eukprot:533129_1
MSTLQTKMSYLINGYVLNQICTMRDEFLFPKELTKLMSQFCGDILLRFDVIHPIYSSYVNENGTIFSRPAKYSQPGWVQFGVCSSISFNEGIHEFRIKCINHAEDAIGITSNTSMCDEENKWFGYYNANTYCYSGQGQIYATSKTDNVHENQDQNRLNRFSTGDIIGVCINCNDWTVQFSHNDKNIGKTLHIVPNMTYHMFIGSSFHGTKYELLL